MKQITIREEQPHDIAAIGDLNEEAFGQPQEARLVDRLRANGGVLLSLVASVDDRVVGHILFSPVTLESGSGSHGGVGLGPMAVLPSVQRRGVGSRLVAEGIKRLRENGHTFVVVVGHPEYYPRFGFVPASQYQVTCPWDVPDEAFMLLVLDESRASALAGVARYREEFATVERDERTAGGSRRPS